MKHLILLLPVLFSFNAVFGQDFTPKDIVVFAGEYNSHEVYHKDDMGNNFIAGQGTGAIDFDFGAGINTLPASSFRDLYLAKYDAANNLQWLLSFDGNVVDNQIRALASDDLGNIYIGGAFSGTLNLTEDGQNEISSFGSASMFVAKFDTNGNLLWQFTVGDTNFSQYPDAMYIVDNRLLIQLVYSGTFDVDPGPEMTMLSGNSNAMLVYGLDGNFMEANTHKGKTNVRTSVIDAEGNLYLGGYFSGLVTLDYKSNASILASGLFDAYLAKYDKSFDLIWLRKISKSSETLIFDKLALDSNGDLVAAGNFASGTSIGAFTAANDAIYLVNVTKEGEFTDLLEILPETSILTELTINPSDQIILASNFNEVIDIDPSTESQTLTPVDGNSNFFLAIYESDFTLLGSGQIYADAIQTLSVQLDDSDELNILVDFQGEGKVVFGSEVNYTASNEENFLFYKLDIGGCNETMGAISMEACLETIINGEIYLASGNYQQILINAEGCDSILDISLTIFPLFQSNETVESCGPYELNGMIYTVSGFYTLELTSINGCDSTIVLDVEIIEIDKNISISDEEIISDENEGDAYQWYDCTTDLPIENATESLFTPMAEGSYKVEITKGFCKEFSDCIDFSIVGIEDYHFDFNVSPNPTDRSLYIQIDNWVREYGVSILDVTGKVVIGPTSLNPDGLLDLGHLKAGIYLLKMKNGNQTASKRIIKI